MGPEPMTSTERRSSRLGTAGPLHQRAENGELTRGVVRAGCGLGVVLDAERGRVEQPDPLDHAVVEVDMADPGPAERRIERGMHLSIMHYGRAIGGQPRSQPVGGPGAWLAADAS